MNETALHHVSGRGQRLSEKPTGAFREEVLNITSTDPLTKVKLFGASLPGNLRAVRSSTSASNHLTLPILRKQPGSRLLQP